MNFPYWTFLGERGAELADNPRTTLIYRTLDRMPPDRVAAIKTQAARLLDGVCSPHPGERPAPREWCSLFPVR